MLFVVVWGSYVKRRQEGIVADWCPQCGAVQRFLISRYHRVDHFNLIPVGPGQGLGSTRQCEVCTIELQCDTADYIEILPSAAARAMPLTNLIAETNQELDAQSPEAQKFRQRLDEATRAYADLPPALAAIDQLPAGQVKKKKLKEVLLERWSTLSAQGRAELIQPVQAQLEREQRRADMVEYVRNVLGFAPRPPAAVVFVLLLAAGLPLSCLTIPPILSWLFNDTTAGFSVCFLPFVVLAGVLLLSSLWSRWVARAWFQRYIIDRARRDNLEIWDVVRAMRELEWRPPGNPNARNLLRYAGVLEGMVLRQFRAEKPEA